MRYICEDNEFIQEKRYIQKSLIKILREIVLLFKCEAIKLNGSFVGKTMTL